MIPNCDLNIWGSFRKNDFEIIVFSNDFFKRKFQSNIVQLELRSFIVEELLSWKIVSNFPIWLPLPQKTESWNKCKFHFIWVIISVGPWRWYVANLISVIESPYFIRKLSLNSSESILSAGWILISLRAETYSAEFSFKAGTIIFQVVELSYGNVTPMRNLDCSLHACKIYLRLVVDTVNHMLLLCKRFSILLFEHHSPDSLWLSILIVIASK